MCFDFLSGNFFCSFSACEKRFFKNQVEAIRKAYRDNYTYYIDAKMQYGANLQSRRNKIKDNQYNSMSEVEAIRKPSQFFQNGEFQESHDNGLTLCGLRIDNASYKVEYEAGCHYAYQRISESNTKI